MNAARSIQFNLGLPDYRGASLFAAIFRDRPSSAIVRGMLHDRPEIGLYRGPLADDEVARFDAAIAAAGLWHLPEPPPLHPDTLRLTVFEVEGTTVIAGRNRAWPLSALPAAIGPVLGALDRLVASLRSYPRRVLAGSAAWSQTPIRATAPVELTISLTNCGDERLRFGSPFFAAPGAPRALQLLLNPRSSGDSRARAVALPISADALEVVGGATPADPFVDLAAKAALRLRASVPAYLSPDEYDAVLLIRSVAHQAPGPTFVDGQISVELDRLVITA